MMVVDGGTELTGISLLAVAETTVTRANKGRVVNLMKGEFVSKELDSESHKGRRNQLWEKQKPSYNGLLT